MPSVRLGASVLSGTLLFACFPRLDWHFLVWVACVPLLAAIVGETRLTRGFLMGYLAGAIFWTGSCYWFVGVVERYGAVNRVIAVGVLALFVVVFSVIFGAFGLVEVAVARRSWPLALMLSPFLWVSMELARTHLITGFPWNLLGYAVQATGLRQIASVTAVYGLSFLAASTSAQVAWVLLAPRQRRAWVLLGVWLALLAGANWVLNPPALPRGSSTALLVQPNVPLDAETLEEKWLPWENRQPLDRLIAMTLSAVDQARPGDAAGSEVSGFEPASISSPLVVWAENPAPFYFTRDEVFRGAMEEMARRARAYVVFNTVTFTGEDRPKPKNSAILLDPEGRALLQYDKIHLVPFGEYVPEWAFPSKVGKITFEVGTFAPGTSYRVAETLQGSIGVFICYEAIFPQLVRRLTPPSAGVLVNISNDAWYGDSSAAPQHLEMARLRAIENGRYLLRATNDGITAVIDPFGRLLARLPRHQAKVLPGRFDYLAKRTFYTAYGDVFAWLCVAVSVLLVVLESVKKSETRAEADAGFQPSTLN